jgi:hypothetical protein
LVLGLEKVEQMVETVPENVLDVLPVGVFTNCGKQGYAGLLVVWIR